MERFYIRSGRGRYEVRDREGERHVVSYSDRDQRPTPEQLASARNIYDARHQLTRAAAADHAAALNRSTN